jgi:formiminoglutamase
LEENVNTLKLEQFSLHRPGDPSKWKGRNDGMGSHYLHEVIRKGNPNLSDVEKLDEKIAFVGFCSDEGVKRNKGRPGAVLGPDSLRKALANLPLSKNSNKTFFDIGDIVCENGHLEKAQAELGELIYQLLNNHFFPVVLGGGHEVAWGHYLGLSQAYIKQDLAIVNFDAHIDMRPLHEKQGNSGTSFLQIANDRLERGLAFNYNCIGVQKYGNSSDLFATAEKYKVRLVMAEEFHLGGIETPLEIIEEIIAQSEKIYVTICLDVFAAAYAPGVSAPQPLGLSPWHVIPLLASLKNSGKLLGLDIAELSPPHDRDEMTAKLAAQLIAQIIF